MRGMGRFWKKLGETIGCGKPPRKTGNKTRRSGLKIAVGTLLFVIVSTALPFLLRENHLSTNMDALLPADPWIAAHLDFLRNSRIGSTAAVSLEAKPGADPAKLPLFAERFAKLTSREPLVGKVFHRIPPRKATNALAFLCLRMPQILSPTNLNELEKSSATNRIGALMRALYKEMTRPGALFRQKLAASDPLSLHQKIIAKLRFLAGNSGFRFHPREDGLWSDDGRHLLVLVRTEAPISDAGRGESFVEALKRLLEASKPSSKFNYIIMAGHRHAVDNRRLLQRDITVTMTVAAIGFILLFSFLFRDWRAVFVFIVPFLGMGSAIGLTWLFFDTPSAIILGMGATVIGIALDYGIHVFVAAKAAGTAPRNASTQPGDCVAPSPQNEKNVRNTSEECGAVPSNLSQSVDKAVSEVIHPIVFSALTTLGVFWAFFLSSSPGY
ncbi:MAG: hypothetical protein KAG97_13520, partial [Victivallales bacterium]|nr:hypothetical protein [Victivallales bacterium]